MIIRKVDTITLKTPLNQPFTTSLRSVTHLNSIIVTMVVNDNIIGFGETAAAYEVTGEDEESIIESIHTISSKIKNVNFDSLDSILSVIHNSTEGNHSAKAALEIALYDIFSKMNNQPLYKFLGGTKKHIKTGMTISLSDIETMLLQSEAAILDGFKSLKIKLGNNVKEDISKVVAISKMIDESVSLKLDANQGWSVRDSIKFLKEIENHQINIDFIEQPIKKDDISGLKEIKDSSKIPILADESAFSINDVKNIISKNAADYINIKLDKCGGISKALQIADECGKNGIKCMMGCMLEGPISIAAAAHVVSARNDIIKFVDLDGVALLKENYTKGKVIFDKSDIILSNSNGLGVSL